MQEDVMSTSLWGRELKSHPPGLRGSACMSTSLWGRELKYFLLSWLLTWPSVDLLVRSWIEMSYDLNGIPVSPCRPPCEVVNWNSWIWRIRTMRLIVDLLVRSWIEMTWHYSAKGVSRVDLLVRSWIEIRSGFLFRRVRRRRPPCEVVNWNTSVIIKHVFSFRRPPCEVVNWNTIPAMLISAPILSTSLWGRELKYTDASEQIKKELSTSLWGRELKLVKDYAINELGQVDLLVRSWIEILKLRKKVTCFYRRPPCEVVNWNYDSEGKMLSLADVDLLVRSWIEKIISYSWYYSKSTARNVYICFMTK